MLLDGFAAMGGDGGGGIISRYLIETPVFLNMPNFLSPPCALPFLLFQAQLSSAHLLLFLLCDVQEVKPQPRRKKKKGMAWHGRQPGVAILNMFLQNTSLEDSGGLCIFRLGGLLRIFLFMRGNCL